MLCHNACIIYFTSSHQVGILIILHNKKERRNCTEYNTVRSGKETTTIVYHYNHSILLLVVVNLLLWTTDKLNFVIGMYVQEKQSIHRVQCIYRHPLRVLDCISLREGQTTVCTKRSHDQKIEHQAEAEPLCFLYPSTSRPTQYQNHKGPKSPCSPICLILQVKKLPKITRMYHSQGYNFDSQLHDSTFFTT